MPVRLLRIEIDKQEFLSKVAQHLRDPRKSIIASAPGEPKVDHTASQPGLLGLADVPKDGVIALQLTETAKENVQSLRAADDLDVQYVSRKLFDTRHHWRPLHEESSPPPEGGKVAAYRIRLAFPEARKSEIIAAAERTMQKLGIGFQYEEAHAVPELIGDYISPHNAHAIIITVSQKDYRDKIAPILSLVEAEKQAASVERRH